MDYDIEHPWTRQPCDDDEKWRAFVCFRDGPLPRNLVDTAKLLGYPTATLAVWADEDAWQDRAHFYDRHLDVQKAAMVGRVLGEDASERAGRHIALLRGMQEVVGASVRDWLHRVAKGEIVVNRPQDVIKAIKEMVTLERLVHGETTANIRTNTTFDLGKLSLEELDALQQLEAKAASNK